MAKYTVHGLSELALAIHDAGEIPDEVKTEIAKAGAEVIAEATRETARSMGVYDEESNVHVADKIKVSKPNVKKTIKAYVTVSGTRKRGENKTKTRNAEIAFINEFGADKRNITARPFFKKAVKKSEEEAVDAAADVFYKWLESKNL